MYMLSICRTIYIVFWVNFDSKMLLSICWKYEETEGCKFFFFLVWLFMKKLKKKKIQIEECILGNLLSFVSLFKENGEEYLLTFFLF